MLWNDAETFRDRGILYRCMQHVVLRPIYNRLVVIVLIVIHIEKVEPSIQWGYC